MGNTQSAAPVSASKPMPTSSPGPCPVINDSNSADPSSPCPAFQGDVQPVYNVYNKQINAPSRQSEASSSGGFSALRKQDGDVDGKLDPSNNMPVVANQLPAPGQRQVISTERQQSTIPKGGTDTTWTYPSPQMFYNALVRKNKADDVTEADMQSVVSVHNAMNEMTWQTVLNWERLHAKESGEVEARLLRFRGRPDELSPRARWHVMMGGDAPFDRHDWYIQRGDKEVRYIIDFYTEDSPDGSPNAFVVDTRPALDNVENALDRAKMTIYQQCYQWGLPCPLTGNASKFGPDASAMQKQ